MIYFIVLTVINVLLCVDSRKNNVPLFSIWGLQCRGKFLFFFLGGGAVNINVAFRIRKKGGRSCLYLIHLGWIAQGWVKITQDSAKFGFRYET